jgi:DNA modification methylase
VKFYPTPDVDLSGVPDGTLTGAIVCGIPSEEQVAEFMRALRPGAHFLLVAPDEQPTGHTGACRLEDGGFEIRDSILVVEEPGRLHYVPKAARKEREAGCKVLPAKVRKETRCKLCDAVLEEGEDFGECESSEDGVHEIVVVETNEKIRNFHPTVKTIKLMKRLLSTISTDKGPVLDPFLGSGSTLIACLETGHDAIGIEREEDYLLIADARIRHWAHTEKAWVERNVESDVDSREKIEAPKGGVFDLFGGGGVFGK